MRLLSRFVIAALVGFSVSSLIALASYSLGLWDRDSVFLVTTVRYSVPFALLLGVAAAAHSKRSTVDKSTLLIALLTGTVLAFGYTYFVARFSFPISVFAFLMLSCWVPSGISAMLVAAFGKRLSVMTGVAVLCLAAIFLKWPVFNAFAHDQQLTVAFIAPFDASTAQVTADPRTFGFHASAEIQIAEHEVIERVHDLGYADEFRVLSLSRLRPRDYGEKFPLLSSIGQAKGRSSLAIVVIRSRVKKEVVLPEPDGSTVVYVQQSDDWEKKPPGVPTLRRGIEIWPPGQTGDELGFFIIRDASGSGLAGRITGRVSDQPR